MKYSCSYIIFIGKEGESDSVGIHGNEAVDELAKKALTRNEEDIRVPLDKGEIKSNIKKNIKKELQEIWDKLRREDIYIK